MSANLRKTLTRISEANHQESPGEGLSSKHLVPVCAIRNRELAKKFKELLEREEIDLQWKRERLCTQFWVVSERLVRARQLHEQLVAQQPDVASKRFSRDYDSVILLSPITALLVAISLLIPRVPKHAWLPVLVSCVTVMVVIERLNRLYRNLSGLRWGISDLLWITFAVGINVGVWRMLLKGF